MVIEMAPFPRYGKSLKQLAFIITSSILIAGFTVTATWKGIPSHVLNIGVQTNLKTPQKARQLQHHAAQKLNHSARAVVHFCLKDCLLPQLVAAQIFFERQKIAYYRTQN